MAIDFSDMTAGAEVDAETPEQALILPSSGLSVSLAKAEIDQQITTAKQYPRSIKRVSDRILTLATIDDEAAKECMYSLPRGGKPIVGPSVRLAEIIASQWGNCRVAARMTDIDRENKRVEAQGLFWDLETNVGQMATVHRRIVDKHGRLYNDDMILVTGNAACAIGRRNAILMGVPKAVWRKAYEAAVAVIRGDTKTLSERRDAAYKAFAAFGVKPDQLFAAIGIAGEVELTIDHIPVLIGMHNSLKNGESTVEEMFAAKRVTSDFAKSKNPLADDADAATTSKEAVVDPATGEVTTATAAAEPQQQADQQTGEKPATEAAGVPEQSAATSASSPDAAQGAADAPHPQASAAPSLFGKGRK